MKLSYKDLDSHTMDNSPIRLAKRNSLRTKIFYAIFGLVAVIEIIIFLCILFAADYMSQKWSYEHLEQESKKLIAQMHSTDYLAFWGQYPYRISLIDKQGVVLYDNRIARVNLGNHKDREEVIGALQYGSGYARRTSESIEERTLYFAKYIPEYQLVLRISMNQKALYAIRFWILGYVVVILLIALFISAIVAKYLARSIVAPLDKLDSLDMKSFQSPYSELSGFFAKIIAQKKKIKKQLKIIRYQHQQFQTISQNINEGYVLLDARKSILAFNQRAQEILPSLQVGAYINTIHKHSNDLQAQVFSHIDFGIIQIQTKEIQIQDYHIEAIALPIWGKTKPKAFMVLLLDRSAKNQIQRLKREFSANVTHELKTPLSVIMASSEMMKQGMIAPKDVVLFSEKIYNECKRLLEIINDILKLSFFDEGGGELEKQSLNLEHIANRVLNTLEPLISQNQLQVRLICPQKDETIVFGVDSLLEDMLYNLCENAIKYNAQGGRLEIRIGSIMGLLPYSTSHTRITQPSSKETNTKKIYIAIKDSGIGIPKDEQQRVFERFYRVDKSRSKKLGGTGLGLCIVKHIALYHNAQILLQSDTGKGCEVVVVFDALQV